MPAAAFILLSSGVGASEILTLNQDCVVSILNRTVYAEIDGSFEMPNVPANLGNIKARATCVRDGETITAETDYFAVVSNEEVDVGVFYIGVEEVIPTRLQIVGGNSRSFSSLGARSTLAVDAVYAGGNVIPAGEGLNFTSSNPDVVSVNPFGEMTAEGPGVALVTIRKDGVVAVLSAQVVTSGDSDGDGIADAIEIAQGLNPNDPIDGLEDWDSDGLANRDEIDNGTAIDNPDTDGDGAEDGEELLPGVDGYISNPLIVDTDGDGISDGLELLAGTDPSDPLSNDFSALIASLDVFPPSVEFTANAVDGTQGVQLTVNGNLLDGSRLDLTDSSDYASDDLLICNFGGPGDKGKVFLGEAGSCTVTVSNANESTDVPFTVERFDPTPLTAVNLTYPAYNVDIDPQAKYAYLADSHGLTIYAISNPLAPQLAGELSLGTAAYDVKVVDTTVYLASGAAGVVIVDTSDPTNPTELTRFDTAGTVEDLYFHEGTLYVADGAGGLVILDVSTPSLPSEVSSTVVAAPVYGVALQPTEGYVVLAQRTAGFEIVDVNDPSLPVSIGSLAGGDVRDVAIYNNFAVLADLERSFVAADLTDPGNPVLGATTARENGGLLKDVVVVNELALAADVFFFNGVPIINVEDPLVPAPRAILDFSEYEDDNGIGIAANDEMAFLAAGARLYIGRYRRCADGDEDDLCDAREPAWGTDTSLADSDNDGLNDGYEVLHGLNPNDSTDAALADTDEDGLGDVEELLVYFTNPLLSDTDVDLLPDGWEVDNGFDPLDPADGAADADGDGFSNGTEFLAGTDPNDPLSRPALGTENWSLPLSNTIADGSPVIDSDGRLYITGTSGRLYAITPRGDLEWSYQASGAISHMPTLGPDGTLYFGAHDGRLNAVSPDGSLRWSFVTGSSNHVSPALGADGTVYTATRAGWIYAVDQATGAEVWSVRVQSGYPLISGSIAVAQDGTIYLGFGNRILYALNPDGTYKWQANVLGKIDMSPAIAPDGTIVVGTEAVYSAKANGSIGSMYAFNPEGIEKWQFHVRATIVGSPAIDAHGIIYFGATDGFFYSLNADGSLRWSYDAGGAVRSSPALGRDGTVYFGADDGYVRALNPDGSLKWEFQGDGSFRTSPVIADDSTLYIGSIYGYFYSLVGGSGGPAAAGWPQFGADPRSTGNQCGYFDPIADLDGDGINDCREHIAGSDPFNALDGASLDSDADGITDLEESNLATDPLQADTDGDMLPDGWEVDNGLNPLSALDAAQDSDADGYSALLEFQAGTDPGNSLDTPAPGTGLWQYKLDSPTYQSLSAPTLDGNGQLYIGAFGNMNAYVLTTDGQLVRRNTASQVDASPPVAQDGTYYLTYWGSSSNRRVLAFDADGNEVWRHQIFGLARGSAGIGPDGTIYIGLESGGENELLAIASDGTRRWNFDTGGDISGSVAIGADGTIYFGSHDKFFYALYPDGSQKWYTRTEGEIHSSPALGAQGQIVFGSRDDYVYAFAADGALLWRYLTGGDVDGSAAIATDGSVYIGSNDGKVYAINADGSLKWSYTTAAGVVSTPALDASGNIVIGSGDGFVYALDISSGAMVWRYDAGAAVRSGIAIDSEGRVFAGSVDGVVHAIVGSDALATGGWPRFGGNQENTGNQCGYYSTAVDTDGDGVRDCREWIAGTDLLDSLSGLAVDSDNDGLTDADEALLYLTDPFNRDTDGDRLADGWEITQGLDALDDSDGRVDSDGDNHSNWLEFLAQTDPLDVADTPQGGELGWRYKVDTEAFDSVTAPSIDGNGRLYIGAGASNHYLYILDPDGSLVRRSEAVLVRSSPAVGADGTYYTDSYKRFGGSRMYAYTADGSRRWTITPGTYATGGAALGTDGALYIGRNDYYVLARNADGSERWTKRLDDGEPYGSIAIDAAGTIYATTEFKSLYALNSDGSVKWRYDTDGWIYTSPAIGAQGQIIIGTQNDYIEAIGPDGVPLWRYQTGGDVDGSAVIAADGSVYAGSADGSIYALNSDGSLKWSYATGGAITSTPALDTAGRVIIGSGDGHVYALDTATGAPVWQYAAGAAVISGIAIDDEGVVYAASVDGYIHAIVGGAGQAIGGWPRFGGDAANTGNQCGYFDPAVDSDSDGSNDCEEWYLGTQP